MERYQNRAAVYVFTIMPLNGGAVPRSQGVFCVPVYIVYVASSLSFDFEVPCTKSTAIYAHFPLHI